MEESWAILEEWRMTETTQAYLESHGEDMFDSAVLSASRTGPVLKKTVLDYRFSYALLCVTENFAFVYDLIKGTVSDHSLINGDCELESTAAETLDCVSTGGCWQIALCTTDQQTEGASPSLLQSHHTASWQQWCDQWTRTEKLG